MATTPTVLGNVPLEYTDPNGKQVSIPLSALFFDPKKNNQLSVDPSKWPDPKTTPVTLPPYVASLLADLAQQQLIVPAPVPSPNPAMVITASDPGSAGNNIQVVFAITTANADPTQTLFQATVTETESYKGLSLNSASSSYIETVLGSDTVTSPTPALVHVIHATLGVAGTPATAAGFKVTSNPNARADVSDTTPKVLFTLEAKKAGKDGEETSVLSVGANLADPTTFDLSVRWTKVASDLTLGNMQANIATVLGYEIGASAPKGGIFSVPAAGAIQLTGGADGTPGSAASAIVFAGQ